MAKTDERSPEFKKAMAHLSRARGYLLDAQCIMAGFGKRHPLRKQFRKAMRDASEGKRTRDMLLVSRYLRIRKEYRERGEITPEMQHKLDDALLDYHNRVAA